MSVVSDVAAINELLKSKNLAERLAWIAENYDAPVYSSSLQREGQYIIWSIADASLPIRIITLQTGRLFPETLALLEITQERYGIEIEQIAPNPIAIQRYVKQHGENGFYESVDARKSCCNVRKVQPLESVLKQADAWITGLTREQSDKRKDTQLAVWNEDHQVMKFNPLADISAQEIEEAIVSHEIPVNPLYERGYASIGCEPCTRAIKPGEHPRAGRWWWEDGDNSECGLHMPLKAANG